MSNDIQSVLAIVGAEKTISNAKEIIKNPMVLEFLGLERESAYYEKDLEESIITHLQDFLLELGNGFSFVARQKRIHLDGDDFFIDLVFYNRLMQCFVISEIKTHKLTHEDLGQLQMYVNYYDRMEKLEYENKTIGILLCRDKNNIEAEFALRDINKPMGVSEFQITENLPENLKSSLQTIEEIENEFNPLEE